MQQHIEVLDQQSEYPLNLVVEMRFTKSTAITMASNNETRFGKDTKYVHIEFLRSSVTFKPEEKAGWHEFVKTITTEWKTKFHAFPHWAKDWEPIDGKKLL